MSQCAYVDILESYSDRYSQSDFLFALKRSFVRCCPKKRKRQSKDLSITDSISFPSGFPDVTAQKRTEAKESFERYWDLILENIDYNVLASDPHVDREQLDEIAQLVQETVCSTRSRIRVAGNDYPAEVVRSKLLKLNSEHIRFVTDCLKQNTTRIRNIRQYLLTVLFNAPSTMNSYYTALVAHDKVCG